MKKQAMLAALFGLTALTAQAELILNGSFEAGPSASAPTDWQVGGGTPYSPAKYAGDFYVPPRTGIGAADLGPSGTMGENGGYLEQTVNLGPGSYLLSFWYRGETGDPLALIPFQVDLSGAHAASFTLNGTQSYQQHTVNFAVASPGSFTIRFTDTQTVGGLNGVIDDVSLTSVSSVPEPTAALLLLCAGLTPLAASARRRQNQTRL